MPKSTNSYEIQFSATGERVVLKRWYFVHAFKFTFNVEPGCCKVNAGLAIAWRLAASNRHFSVRVVVEVVEIRSSVE